MLANACDLPLAMRPLCPGTAFGMALALCYCPGTARQEAILETVPHVLLPVRPPPHPRPVQALPPRGAQKILP